MKQSSAFKLLNLVWENGKKDSWQRINYSMRDALALAIASGLSFNASDFDKFASLFRWQFWVTESVEWIYTDAIVNLNQSCVEAFEKWAGRSPFVANHVSSDHYYRSYLHTSSVSRARSRLAVGLSFAHDNKKWKVTSFNDKSGTMIAVLDDNESSPKKLLKLTHDQVKAMFPAPKKEKKKAMDERS